MACAATRRSQESGGRPTGRCTRKGFRVLVDEFGRRRGAEGTERWDRWGGRGGSERSYVLGPASSSTGTDISVYEVTRGSGEWDRVI